MSELLPAWQAALAAEHEAVFGYAVLGPHLAQSERQFALSFSDAHEALRDATSAAIAATGRAPVPAAADYPAVYPVPNAAAARSLAVRLEDGCAAGWRYLYFVAASTPGPAARRVRASAQPALTASAIRAARWRAITTPSEPTIPFPGT